MSADINDRLARLESAHTATKRELDNAREEQKNTKHRIELLEKYIREHDDAIRQLRR